MAADNTVLNAGSAGDTIRDLARQAGTIKTQVVQLDIGGATANAEVLVTAGTQVSANSLPVVIASDQTAVNVKIATDITATNNLTALGQVTTTNMNGLGTVNISVANVWTGTIVFEASIDGVTFFAVNALRSDGVIVNNTTANGLFAIPAAGFINVRARCSVFGSGTITLTLRSGGPVGIVSLSAPITQQPLIKGTQGANGVSTQDLKDAGRNQTNYFTATAIAGTAVDTLQSLTGYKSGAAVGATTTPAVVTAGKTYRLNRIAATFVSTAVLGYAIFTLRANTGGVVLLASPAVDSWALGAAVAGGASETINIDLPDGIEFAGGTGVGVSVQSFNAAGVATASGLIKVSFGGFEY